MRSIRWISLLLAGLLCSACETDKEHSQSTDRPQLSVAVQEAFRPPCRTEVSEGDTLESVCRRLAGDDWIAWRDALLTELDPRRLQLGTAFEGTQSSSGRLEDLRVTLDLRSELRLARVDGAIQLERITRPIASRELRFAGSIESSLFAAVSAAGGRPELAVRLAEIFQWDVDFLRDLRQGDSFVLLVEEQSVADQFFGYGTIYAARFINDGRTLDAIAYPDADGRIGYFDLDGRPLRKQFLRSPLKFSRITSRFTPRRFHPVLKRTMPHYGVDYGAPVGTAAHVTADGTVSFVGRNGGAGRMVTVRHPNGYETSYLHLSGYGPGIQRGARVRQGQVIGYVGSSGYSTGSHLDYRVKLNGRWVNPLAISSPPTKPLEEERLPRYLTHALAIISVLGGAEAPVGASC